MGNEKKGSISKPFIVRIFIHETSNSTQYQFSFFKCILILLFTTGEKTQHFIYLRARFLTKKKEKKKSTTFS